MNGKEFTKVFLTMIGIQLAGIVALAVWAYMTTPSALSIAIGTAIVGGINGYVIVWTSAKVSDSFRR